MMDDSNYSDEVEEQLLQALSSLKKQSVFSLIFAIICLVVMVFLFFKLQKTNQQLKDAKQELAQQKKLLENQQAALTKEILNELNDWRISQLESGSPPVEVIPEPVEEQPADPVRNRGPQAGVSPNSNRVPNAPAQSQAPQVTAIQAPSQSEAAHRVPSQPSGSRKQIAVLRKPFSGNIIYIQDTKKRKATADLREALKEKGAIVPAIQSKNLPGNFATSIKYFHKQDEKAAKDVKRLLQTTLKNNGIGAGNAAVPITYVANAKVSLGQLEVWVGN